MIYVYGMAYWTLEYSKKSVQSMWENASEDFKLIIVEGHSERSEEFKAWREELKSKNQYYKYVKADKNCYGWGLIHARETIPPDDSEDFIILTDLDLIVPKGADWIKEIREGLKTNWVVGCDLSTENYKPPNWGFSPDCNEFGTWLMAIKKGLLTMFPKGVNVQDHIVLHVCRQLGGTYKKLPIKLFHCTWDTYWEYPEYWARKNPNMWQEPVTDVKYEVFD